jgi:hypothetical protein
MRAAHRSEEWFIECKRFEKSSGYSERERQKWLSMWANFRDYLIDREISVVLDIVFHIELESLPTDFLMTELAGKLELVQPPCCVQSNETWEVSVQPVDYRAAHEHLRRYSVKYPSDQLNELIGGHRDPNRGFTAAVKGDIVRIGDGPGSNYFLDELVFAIGAYWSCDAGRAIERKARDIRRHLAEAVEQLPETGKGVVHIGLETLDGAIVEAERYARIVSSMYRFDARDKDLRWVYCHLFQSYAPPEQCWVIDETVYFFGRSGRDRDEPIRHRPAVVPEDASDDDPGADSGAHWLRPPP